MEVSNPERSAYAPEWVAFGLVGVPGPFEVSLYVHLNSRSIKDSTQ